jgi:hypothetical protein
MGRPLNHKYFGDNNPNSTNNDEATGGEGIASVTAPAGTLASLVNGTYTIPAASIGAPDIAGGKKAQLRVVVTGTTTYTVTVVSPGTGYTSAPTITFNGSVAGGSGSATPVATLTTSAIPNAISVQAITIGSTNRTSGNDIIRQTGSKRFQVRTQDGVAVCALVQATPSAAGQMAIVATDSSSKTYYVRKITNRLVTLTQFGSAGHEFANGKPVKWVLGSAVNGVSVTLANA